MIPKIKINNNEHFQIIDVKKLYSEDGVEAEDGV